MRVAWKRFGGLHALGVAILLTLSVALGWCLGTGVRSFGDLSLPTAYLDIEKSDVIFQLAHIKAAATGHFTPTSDKVIPELGAPHAANWSDWPHVEEVPFWLMGQVARATNLFAALNLGLLSGHLLAAISFFMVSRFSGIHLAGCFVGGLAFGLAPYLFAQSPHHLSPQLCWHIPLFLPVWRWTTDTQGIAIGSRRFYFSIGVAIVTGLQSVYFTFVFCQLLVLGTFVSAWRNRAWQTLTATFLILASTAGAFGLMNLDTWLYRLHHGPNPAAVVRPYQWLEIYGLKAVDLVCPPATHTITPVAEWAIRHWKGGVLIDEGSYLGLVGIVGLLAIGISALRAVVRRSVQHFPLEAWQSLWIFAFFSTGGLNLALGLIGFTLFRANCRLSIVLLAISLMYVMRSWSGKSRSHALPIAAAITLLVAIDQIPRPPKSAERATIARQIAEDQQFVRAMETALPSGAMVLQLPFAAYPESPSPGMTVYDHFRPYLYSNTLRFSFGLVKGRPESESYAQLAAKPTPSLVDAARSAGFKAIYINRAAIKNRADPMLTEFKRLGLDQIIENRSGDLVCVVLK